MSRNKTDSKEAPTKGTAHVAVVKLLFPTAGILLAALYVANTYGRIRPSNLYYPYFVIGLLAFLTATVYVDEIRDLWGRAGDLSFVESVRRTAKQWNRSIGLTLTAVVYLWLIEPIGFFAATFLGMIGIMLVGGLRDWKTMIAVTVIMLMLIYIAFIRLMGLQPPVGPLGV
jgi:hypothetical protein